MEIGVTDRHTNKHMHMEATAAGSQKLGEIAAGIERGEHDSEDVRHIL
jgi:hypothetical protein